MQASSIQLEELLGGNNNPFFIPPFQRSYAWERSELSRFFYDIERLLASEMSGKERKLHHFFGTLVVKSELEGLKSKIIIVDGQQRITTSLIFLIALRDTISNDDEVEHINRRYLTSSDSKYPYGIKLKQVTADWEAYEALIMGKKAPKGKISDAYNYFCRRLSALKEEKPDVTTQRFLVVYSRINLACISLENDPYKGEDPQIIFETLNSLGRPLTLADLIRNYILLGLNSEKQTEVYDNIWFPKIEEVLPLKEVSNFFRDFSQYKLSEDLPVVRDNNTKGLYATFKERVASMYQDTDALIQELASIAYLYRGIVDPEFLPHLSESLDFSKQVKRLLIDIFQEIVSDPFKPFVLGLLMSHQGIGDQGVLSDESLLNALRMIKTYLVRRRVCKLTSGDNKALPMLSQYIPDLVAGEVTMIDLLTNMGYNLRMPNDTEMQNRLEAIAFYKEVERYVKFILGEMEMYQSKVAVDYHNKKVTIEHVMPQILTEIWRRELGPDHEEIHQKYQHNIGNLILTEFNSEMGNRSFAEKKKKLVKSTLGYRLGVLGVEKWDEEAILKHQSEMIELFLNTFQLPLEYRTTNNWNERAGGEGVMYFHPNDPAVEKIATGRKPYSIRIADKAYYEKHWKDMLFTTISHLKNTYPSTYEQLVNDCGTPLKQGKAADIVNWKSSVPSDEALYYDDYYGLADGTKVRDIDSSYRGDKRLIFYHNRSTKELIGFMVKLLDYFSIDADDVVITLRAKEDVGELELPFE